jgi:hypothetical protein
MSQLLLVPVGLCSLIKVVFMPRNILVSLVMNGSAFGVSHAL